MWYLQIDTLGILVGVTLFYALAGHVLHQFRPQWRLTPFLLVLDLGLIAYVSKMLALFYLTYTAFSYLLVWLLHKAKSFRRVLFILFCVLDVLPFFYIRLAGFLPALPIYVTLIGFAYNMLKAVDALFYVYYTPREIHLAVYANFLLFFPVLTAGPIFRYRDFIKAYENPLPVTTEVTVRSVKRFILGMFKKMVLVAWIRLCLNWMLEMSSHFYVSIALAVLSYALLYCDLSGYSDIAIAFGNLVGFPVPENFKNPLSAASFTQFWRKWHVTLSDWIREHIFVVISGKRLNKYLSALIGFCTMMVMSLWYSFSLLSVASGLYMGSLLVIENIFSLTTVDRRRTKPMLYIFRCLLVAVLFAVNTLSYTLDTVQMRQALGGFFRW